MDQCPRRAGADLALIEREHHKALDAFVEIGVIFVGDVGKEDA